MKLKKKEHIKLVVIGVSAFFISTVILLGIVQITNLADKNFLISGVTAHLNSQNFNMESKAQEPPKIELTDLGITPPQFSSNSVLAQDIETGKILYAKNINQKLSPASTTKLMTALIAVDYFKPGDILVVPPLALVGGSTMGLKIGERLTFRSLLYGMLLNSGNDAAYTIALNYPGGYDGFVTQMNIRAQNLGLVNTHFQNPAGFDSPDNYSSAYDLSKISLIAINNFQLAKIVATKQTQVSSLDQSIHNLQNLNKLLEEDGVVGIKTGFTEKSGENLVGLIERNNRKVLTVVLGSTDRFGETKKLINWIFTNFSWQENR